MEVLRSILDGSLSKKQQQRGKAKLRAQYPPYNVELNRLRNADKYINQRVYDSEKAQAEAYNFSQRPPTANEQGKLYKIQAYANPIIASLRGKLTLYQQLVTQINFLRDETQRGKYSSAGAVFLVPDTLKNNYFGTKEILTEYNDLMNYINTYAKTEMDGDKSFSDKITQGIITPILQQMDQLITSYGSFWNQIPAFNNRSQENVMKQMREIITNCWVLYTLMYDNLQNGVYTPITDASFNDAKNDSKRDIMQEILNNERRSVPAPIPLPPQQQIPQVQPVPQPQPPVAPIPQVANIRDVDPAILAQFQPPANILNTDGQTISSKDYFYLLGFKWVEREDEFLGQQLRRFDEAIKREQGEKKNFETRLAEIQAQGARRQVEGQLIQRISDLDASIRQNQEQVKQITARRVKLIEAYELLAEYLRVVAKLPTDQEGNFDVEVRKIRDRDLRTLANNEDAFKNSIGLTGFGKKKLLGSKIDNIDDGGLSFNDEFEHKRQMALNARGNRRVVEPDQNIAQRLSFFDPSTEFNPKLELLKRGFKANDPVMAPDKGMRILPVVGQYEASGLPEDENETAFKQRFGGLYAQHAKRTNENPVQVEYKTPFGGFFDIDGNDEFDTVKNFEGLFKPVEHFKVEEEPDDILDHPDEFRKKIDAYKFNTGRMKTKPKYLEAK